MAGTQSPQEVELLARFPRGFQQDMIADIEALPEPERTFRMDNFIKNYQLQVKGWKKYRTGGGSLEQLLADCIKGMYYAGSLGSNWAWDLRQHLLSSGRFSEIRISALAEMNTGQEPLDMPLSVAMRIALGCWFRHLQHQSSAEDVRLLERLVRQLEKPAGVDFLVTAFQQHNLPFEEFKFVVMRMRLEIKRQVARHSANKIEALKEVHGVSRQLVAAFTEDALPHLLAAECAKEAGMEYCIYGRHLQDSINAAAQVSDEVVGWQAAMLLQTCWFNGEAGKSLNIAHVRSLMHKLRSQNQTLKKWGADRLLRGSQREQWHKMKESYDKLMEGTPSARVIREHLAMAAPESMRPQAACDKCGCAMIRMKRCSGCQRVHYCSRECQRDDWDEHRLECTAMQEQLQEQQLKAALNRLIKGGPLPSLDDPDALAADLDAASVPAHRAPIAEPPPAGMLDPEVQLVLDTMMRVAFPGHTEFATSKLARELAKQIMEQVKSPRWAGGVDGGPETEGLNVLADAAILAGSRQTQSSDVTMVDAGPWPTGGGNRQQGGEASPGNATVQHPGVHVPAAQVAARGRDNRNGPGANYRGDAGRPEPVILEIPHWARQIVAQEQMRMLQQVLQPIGAAANQRQAREITQQLHTMRRRRRELYFVSQLLGTVAAAC